MTEEVRKYLEKAGNALVVAEELAASGHCPDAASKTYYAMFYATQALLKSEGIDVIKHSAVESAFGYYFVKSGRIDPRFHKMLISARRLREVADYDIDEEIVEPVVSLKLEEGRAFVEQIRTLLVKG